MTDNLTQEIRDKFNLSPREEDLDTELSSLIDNSECI